MSGRGVLLVRSEGRQLGIPLVDVVEVSGIAGVQRVPAGLPSFRGVMPARGRLVPLFHLGALVGGRGCPAGAGADTMVLAQVRGRWVALEVDEVDAAPDEEILPYPIDRAGAGWTVGAVRRGEGWVPILNLEALAERWQALTTDP
jgi:chemotaxis signal transduction protein